MNCRKIEKHLPLYASGDLGLREKSAVDIHVGRCLTCFRKFTAYKEDIERLHELRLSESPTVSSVVGQDEEWQDEFLRGVMNGIDGPPPVSNVVPRLIAISGWAAALLLAATVAFHNMGNDGIEQDLVDQPVPVNGISNEPLVRQTPSNGLRPMQPISDWEVDPAHDQARPDLLGPDGQPLDLRALDRPTPQGLPVSFPVQDISDF